MQNIDWSLLIGFPLAEAEEYLKEKALNIINPTTSPKAHRNSSVVDEIDEEDEDLRVIAVRKKSNWLSGLYCLKLGHIVTTKLGARYDAKGNR